MTQAPATPELVERLKAMASMPFTRFHYADDAVMVKQAADALEAQQARIAELEAKLSADDAEHDAIGTFECVSRVSDHMERSR